jgi:hypothetical protein
MFNYKNAKRVATLWGAGVYRQKETTGGVQSESGI